MVTLQAVLDQNLSTIKTFIQLMLDNVAKEVKKVKSEKFELRRSLECKAAYNQLWSNAVQNNWISDRVRQLEDKARCKNLRISGINENRIENYERTQLKDVGYTDTFYGGKFKYISVYL